MRVYINNFDGGPLWSIDSGPGTLETHWDRVQILCEATTEQNLSKRGSKIEPCCWLECKGYLEMMPGKTRFAVIR